MSVAASPTAWPCLVDLTWAGLGIEHLGLFVLAGIVLNLTPGPDVLFFLTQAIRRGSCLWPLA
ncbi:MAG: hypothetical protein KAX57_08120 [Rhodoferax sp.]|nr:hypothetical protein [Rhodoferax sp.]